MSVVEHRKLGTESVGSSIFRIESWELSLLPAVSAWNMRNCELMFSYFLHAKKKCHSHFSKEYLRNWIRQMIFFCLKKSSEVRVVFQTLSPVLILFLLFGARCRLFKTSWNPFMACVVPCIGRIFSFSTIDCPSNANWNAHTKANKFKRTKLKSVTHTHTRI